MFKLFPRVQLKYFFQYHCRQALNANHHLQIERNTRPRHLRYRFLHQARLSKSPGTDKYQVVIAVQQLLYPLQFIVSISEVLTFNNGSKLKWVLHLR